MPIVVAVRTRSRLSRSTAADTDDYGEVELFHVKHWRLHLPSLPGNTSDLEAEFRPHCRIETIRACAETWGWDLQRPIGRPERANPGEIRPP